MFMFKQPSFMRVAQCYTDKQTNIILVLALRTELCGIRHFGLKPIIKGLSPKRRIPQSSVRSASTNNIFVCLYVYVGHRGFFFNHHKAGCRANLTNFVLNMSLKR